MFVWPSGRWGTQVPVKVVLFCGGAGLRLREASERLPKPLIPVGHEPILLHLMRYYAHFGHTEFILCLGHQAEAIKRYFLEYDEALHGDFVLEAGDSVRVTRSELRDWRIHFVDTGVTTEIGERLRLVREHLCGDEYFLANYGDQLSDAPLPDLVATLKKSGKIASLLSVRPPYSTHVLHLSDGLVSHIAPMDDGALLINGGYFVFRQDIFDHMRPGDDLVPDVFPRLIEAGELLGQRHDGFWAPMDTLKDKQRLDTLAETGRPPWAVWLNRGPRPAGDAVPLKRHVPRLSMSA